MTWIGARCFIFSTIAIRYTNCLRLFAVLATIATAKSPQGTQLQTLSAGSRALTVVVTLLALDARRPRHWEDVNIHAAQLM